MPQKIGKGGGARKYGRNKPSCLAYRNEQRREKNKAKRIARHLRRFPQDKVARAAFDALPALATRKINLP